MNKKNEKRFEELLDMENFLHALSKNLYNKKGIEGYMFDHDVVYMPDKTEGVLYKIYLEGKHAIKEDMLVITKTKNKFYYTMFKKEKSIKNKNTAISEISTKLIQHLKKERSSFETRSTRSRQNKENLFVSEAILLALAKLQEDPTITKLVYKPKMIEVFKNGKQFVGLDSNLYIVLNENSEVNINFKRLYPKEKETYKLRFSSDTNKESAIRQFVMPKIENENDHYRTMNEYAYGIYEELVKILRNQI